MILGPSIEGPDKISFGTVFFMGDARNGKFLITAAHVLEGIKGDTATLILRRAKDDDSYETFNYDIAIRSNGRPKYIKHDTADVAVMYVNLPKGYRISILTPEFLVTDQIIKEIDLHPGDEALCLGFPLAVSTPGGFPVLRAGRLGSYPLTPMKTVKSWIFDLFLYPGNSGGPVYYEYANRTVIGQKVRGILGLVSQTQNSNLPEFKDKSLNLGIIVPAYFIQETIDRLIATSNSQQ
jgi:hypothetical protein